MSPGDTTNTSQDKTEDGAAIFWPTILHHPYEPHREELFPRK